MTNYILIDGSYFCFFRYYALLTWWKNAHADDDINVPYENESFVEKFKSTFISKIKEIPKKLKIKDPKIIIAKDCSRKDIWRMNEANDYKVNRVYDDTFMGGPFFKLAYDELFASAVSTPPLYQDHLEADDCIAIATKCILQMEPDANITIITSDTDYLQLLKYDISIYTLKYKELKETKTYDGDPEKYLFCKILMGDKSDDITGVFKKCGPKTAEKCWEDKEILEKKFDEEPGSRDKFEKNKKLISFNEIPEDLIKEFFKNNINKLKI